MTKTVRMAATVLLLATSGCAASLRAPVTGFLYTGAGAGEIATTNVEAPKVGEACATSILGLVGTGDATIEAAAKDGQITRIAYVDSQHMSVIGVYAEYCTVVYGN